MRCCGFTQASAFIAQYLFLQLNFAYIKPQRPKKSECKTNIINFAHESATSWIFRSAAVCTRFCQEVQRTEIETILTFGHQLMDWMIVHLNQRQSCNQMFQGSLQTLRHQSPKKICCRSGSMMQLMPVSQRDPTRAKLHVCLSTAARFQIKISCVAFC